jgi:hypothetical protein
MGREIRRVPDGWEHPTERYRDFDGRLKSVYKPLYDGSYSRESERWIAEFDLWRRREHPAQVSAKQDGRFEGTLYDSDRFWEYEVPPDEECMRPDWEAMGVSADHYQIYETVSEGTPVSPVFGTLEEMKAWLVGEGYSEHAASEFVRRGSAMSMVAFVEEDNAEVGIGIHGFDVERRAREGV